MERRWHVSTDGYWRSLRELVGGFILEMENVRVYLKFGQRSQSKNSEVGLTSVDRVPVTSLTGWMSLSFVYNVFSGRSCTVLSVCETKTRLSGS